MESVAIGVSDPPAEIRGALAAALRPLAGAGARLDVEEVQRGPLVFLGCRLEPEGAEAPPVVGEFRRALARALAGWIVEHREAALLRRLIGTHYSYFAPEEREGILALAVRQLGEGEAAPGPARRQGRVLQRLVEYLDRHNTLVVDGFVTFRLKDYVGELTAAVDQAVDEFLLEREYREFVALLRHVVESQACRPVVAHCLFDLGGGFRLEDDAGRPVGADFLEEVAPEAAARDVGVEDLLVSALITVAPERVRLHVPDGAGLALSQDALGTLQAVFSEAVTVCRGCARCRQRAEG